jgi:hypothetical protein
VSTMQQTPPPAEPGPGAQDMDAAVEAQTGKIMTELGAALGVLLTSLGTRSGLWAALAGAGPLTTADVAARVSVDPSLVQAGGGYLDYDTAEETDAFTRVALPAELIGAAIGDMAGVATARRTVGRTVFLYIAT